MEGRSRGEKYCVVFGVTELLPCNPVSLCKGAHLQPVTLTACG